LPDLPALPEPPCPLCGNCQPPYPNGQCRQCGRLRSEPIDDASTTDDDHFRFRVAWGDTGEWGILVIPKEQWNGFGTHYTSGDWVYAWSGANFQPLRRLIHPTPPGRPSVWGSLGWTSLWAWFRAFLLGDIAAHLRHSESGASSPSLTTGLATVAAVFCLLWLIAHQRRLHNHERRLESLRPS
jgi:hypothetical protein